MDDNEILYISPLGLVIDEEELELRQKQIEEVAKELLIPEKENE